jgi:hypothetical protein
VVTSAPEPTAELQKPIGEQRVVIRGLSWDGYLQILNALPQSRGSRLTFDDGVLEITMPLEEHEFSSRLIECFIRTLIELMGMRMKTMGSTTMNYPFLKKGAEPDNAYYIQNQPLVKGRNVDFTKDPPPDLVVEEEGLKSSLRIRLHRNDLTAEGALDTEGENRDLNNSNATGFDIIRRDRKWMLLALPIHSFITTIFAI